MSEKGGESRLGPHLWDAVPGKWNADGDEVLVRRANVRPPR